MRTGGLSSLKEKNEEIVSVVSNTSKDIFGKLNLSDNCDINVCSYKTQIVAGVIYYTKVIISDKYYHLKIINYLPHENKDNELLSFKADVGDDSEIEYF